MMKPERWRSIGYFALIVILFIFAVLSNVRMIIQNYHLSQKVNDARSEVASLSERNTKLSLLLTYYQSASYQEVEARRRLALKKPDETTVIVKGVQLPAQSLSDQFDQAIQEETPAKAAPESNISRWLKFFFD